MPITRSLVRSVVRSVVGAGGGGGGGSTPLIADTYPMAAAYSLRKVKADATLCLRVRRSSDSTESDIGFSGEPLDTAGLLTFCGAGDGFVTKWYDQSGNSRDWAQATTTAQPKIVSSGAVITDTSLPAVQFDGGDKLVTASAIPGLSGDLTASFFSVHRKTTAANGCAWGIGDSNTVLGLLGLYDDGSLSLIAYGGGNNFVMTGIANDTRYMHSFFKTPGGINTTTKAYRNGVDCSSPGGSASTPNVVAAPLAIGSLSNFGSSQLIGNVQEFFVFTADQQANRTAIEASITDYWGIA